MPLLLFAAAINLPALAETDTIANSRHLNTPLATAIVVKAYPKNVIKMNVTSLLFHNYHFLYKYYKMTLLHKYPGGV